MAKLNADVQKIISQTKIFPVATASKDGVPNVVPFAFLKVFDEETLLLADNFMNKSINNLEDNPQMAVCVWDTENNQSYQIKGIATVFKSGEIFEETVAWVKKIMPELNPKSAVLLKVTNIFICQPGPDLGKEITGTA
jgi:hypothetical protein